MFYVILNNFKIFYGKLKLVTVERKLTQISSMSNQTQIVKIKIPRGFPTGGILKSEVIDATTVSEDVQSIKQKYYIYMYI